MFFVFVLTVKLSMYLSRKLIISFLLTLVTFYSGALYADDYVQMIQYEMSFGGKQSESNVYMSMRPVEYSSHFDADGQDTYRIPVISTNPRKISLLQPLSMLYAEEEPNNAEENIDETSNPVAAVGKAIGGIVVLAVMLAPMAVAVSDMHSYDPCSDGACSIEKYTLPDTFKVPADETGSDP